MMEKHIAEKNLSEFEKRLNRLEILLSEYIGRNDDSLLELQISLRGELSKQREEIVKLREELTRERSINHRRRAEAKERFKSE